MIWGMTLHPGEEWTRYIHGQEHLTLAALECRPQKYDGEINPSSCVLVKIEESEHVLCTLEKGLTPQQNLDLVLHSTETVTFIVEGTGVVYLTGYSSEIGVDTAKFDQSTRTVKSELVDEQLSEATLSNIVAPASLLTALPAVQDSEPEYNAGDEVDHSSFHVHKNLSFENYPDNPANFQSSIQQHNIAVLEAIPTQETNNCFHENKIGETTSASAHDHIEGDRLRTSGDRIQLYRTLHLSTNISGTGCSYQDNSKSFQTQSSLERHRGTYPYQAKNDKLTFRERTQEQLHDNYHRNKFAYKCQYCGKSFVRKSYVKVHERIHTGVTPYKCQYCEKTFKQRVHVRSHEATHTGVKYLKSQYCTKPVQSTRVVPSTDIVATIVPPSDTIATIAPTCDNVKNVVPSDDTVTTIVSSHESVTSTMTAHDSVANLVPSCDNLTSVLSGDSMTTNLSFGVTDLVTPCDSLATSERSFESLSTARLTVDCQYCYKTIAAHLLRQHEESHKPARPYQCQYCGKAFKRKSDLRTHETLHTGNRPFKCQYCDKKFVQSSHVRRHERLHTGEQPFKCQYCDKAFPFVTDRTRHERVHTGEKPFKCRLCGKGFTQSYYAKKHEASHTQI